MRRNVLMWTLLPVMVALGATAGYLAAGTGTVDDSVVTAAHQHAASAPTPVTTSTAGHAHDMPGMSDADMSAMPQPAASSSPATAGHAHDIPGGSDAETASAGPPAAEEHGGGHGSTGTGVSATVRATVVITFVAINAAILLAAVVVRRRTPNRRRPAAQAV